MTMIAELGTTIVKTAAAAAVPTVAATAPRLTTEVVATGVLGSCRTGG